MARCGFLFVLFLIPKISFGLTLDNRAKVTCKVSLKSSLGKESPVLTLHPGDHLTEAEFFKDSQIDQASPLFSLKVKFAGGSHQADDSTVEIPLRNRDVDYEIRDPVGNSVIPELSSKGANSIPKKTWSVWEWVQAGINNTVYFSGLVLASRYGIVIGTSKGAALGTSLAGYAAESALNSRPVLNYFFGNTLMNSATAMGMSAGGAAGAVVGGIVVPVAAGLGWRVVTAFGDLLASRYEKNALEQKKLNADWQDLNSKAPAQANAAVLPVKELDDGWVVLGDDLNKNPNGNLAHSVDEEL